MQKKEMKRRTKIIALFGCIAFFLFWLWKDGVYVAVDTASYVTFEASREPVYPLLLALFRLIFGESHYFWWMAFFQCVLWGYTTWKLSESLSRKMNLGNLFLWMMIAVQLGVNLLIRFLAGRRVLYCVSMSTESIAMPLYLLFITNLFVLLCDIRAKNILVVYMEALFLILTRKQMYITLVIMFVMWGLLKVMKKLPWKRFFLLIVLLGTVFLAAKMTERIYNYCIHGSAIPRMTDVTLLTTSLFVANPEDADIILDGELKEIFSDMVAQVKMQGWGYESAPKSLLDLEQFYSNHYDDISYGILKPTLNKYLDQKEITGDSDRILVRDEWVLKMQSHTMTQNIGMKLKVLCANFLFGLMNTIATGKPFFIGYVFAMLILYMALGAAAIYRRIEWEKILFCILVFTCIMVNVTVVSAMIFTQSRYMIYNMPLFYIAFFIMVYAVVKRSKPITTNGKKEGM